MNPSVGRTSAQLLDSHSAPQILEALYPEFAALRVSQKDCGVPQIVLTLLWLGLCGARQRFLDPQDTNLPLTHEN